MNEWQGAQRKKDPATVRRHRQHRASRVTSAPQITSRAHSFHPPMPQDATVPNTSQICVIGDRWGGRPALKKTISNRRNDQKVTEI